MGRAPKPIISTPPGFKRCKHCAKSNNTFIDVRDKHNECELCRINRRKKKTADTIMALPDATLAVETGYLADAHTVVLSPARVTMADRISFQNGKRVTRHATTSDTAEIFEDKEHAFETLVDMSHHNESFRFHGRYVAADPPPMPSPDAENNRDLVISYIHNLNADVGDALGWRWTSRGRENRNNIRKVIAVHYNCCQDAERSRPRKPPKNPEKAPKRKSMDRWHCNGRMTIAYEPEHKVVELRIVHEINHPPYVSRKDGPGRFAARAPVPIAAPSGLSALAQITDPTMLSAQEASMLYAGSAGPSSPILESHDSPPSFMTIDPSLHHPHSHVQLHHHGSHLDVPVPPFVDADDGHFF